MNEGLVYRDQLLSDLNDSIFLAADFFMQVDEDLFDGHQTAREVLSHLVFWHREYHAISKALVLGEKPSLLSGSLAVLNEKATCEFQEEDLDDLARQLIETQANLADNLRQLENWNVNFPFKKGCRKIDVAGRICAINLHVRHHLVRQERAYRRGEDWIKAYYLDTTT